MKWHEIGKLAAAEAKPARTHCVNGHEFTPENVYLHEGHRRCTECRRQANRRRVDRDADRLRQRARRKLNYEIERGRLIRPTSCARCGGDGGLIEAHHRDYSRPLDVEWLCSACHGKTRRAEVIQLPVVEDAALVCGLPVLL